MVQTGLDFGDEPIKKSEDDDVPALKQSTTKKKKKKSVKKSKSEDAEAKDAATTGEDGEKTESTTKKKKKKSVKKSKSGVPSDTTDAVSQEESNAFKAFVTEISCSNLPQLDFFSKSDPIVRIYKKVCFYHFVAVVGVYCAILNTGNRQRKTPSNWTNGSDMVFHAFFFLNLSFSISF